MQPFQWRRTICISLPYRYLVGRLKSAKTFELFQHDIFERNLCLNFAMTTAQKITVSLLLGAGILHPLPAEEPKKVAMPPSRTSYERRVELVRGIPGLAAFWDFVQRENSRDGRGNFIAYTSVSGEKRYPLQPQNISRLFWKDGEEASLNDFPLLGRGPFGQAVQFHSPKALNDLPVLLVPREVLHDTPLDVKGPGRSVSMVVWLIHQEDSHAIAGMWHEGTDTPPTGIPAVVKVRGQRQYGMFAGLGANPGASSAHVSENGLASFGDKYAHHLASTREKMRPSTKDASPKELDQSWSVAGFVYDNQKKNVTAYLNGVATEYWIEKPAAQGFFKHAARAWQQARFAKFPGLQEGEDPAFPADQFYTPPETTPLSESIELETAERRVLLRTFEYTKVRLTFIKGNDGQFHEQPDAELVALKANPYWFGHDIYSPPSAQEGSPFTIGRVIHSNRHPTLSAWFGGVAVYANALTPEQMAALATIGRSVGEGSILRFEDTQRRP